MDVERRYRLTRLRNSESPGNSIGRGLTIKFDAVRESLDSRKNGEAMVNL